MLEAFSNRPAGTEIQHCGRNPAASQIDFEFGADVTPTVEGWLKQNRTEDGRFIKVAA